MPDNPDAVKEPAGLGLVIYARARLVDPTIDPLDTIFVCDLAAQLRQIQIDGWEIDWGNILREE